MSSKEPRNKLFGLRLSNDIHHTCSACFEFLQFSVTTGKHLNRHMDYRNAHHIGYDVGACHSFFHIYQQKEYRVTIIATNGIHCDQFMADNN